MHRLMRIILCFKLSAAARMQMKVFLERRNLTDESRSAAARRDEIVFGSCPDPIRFEPLRAAPRFVQYKIFLELRQQLCAQHRSQTQVMYSRI